MMGQKITIPFTVLPRIKSETIPFGELTEGFICKGLRHNRYIFIRTGLYLDPHLISRFKYCQDIAFL